MDIVVGELILSLVKECLLPKLVSEAGNYTLRRAKGSAPVTLPAHDPPRPRWEAQPAGRLGTPVLHVVPATSVVSATPGRARLHVASMRGEPARARAVGERVNKLPGVYQATASATTGNVLVEFDEARTTLARIRAALQHPFAPPPRQPSRRTSSAPPAGPIPSPHRQLRLVGF